MIFWAIATGFALISAAVYIVALLKRDDPQPSDLERNLTVYRRMLSELDQDEARSVLGKEEAEQSRLEIKRRILRAAREFRSEADTNATPIFVSRMAVFIALLLLLPGSVALYLAVGSPGQEDLPRQARIELANLAYTERPSQDEFISLLGGAAPDQFPAGNGDSGSQSPAVPDASETDGAESSLDQLRANYLAAIDKGDLAAATSTQRDINALLGDSAGLTDRMRLAELYIGSAGGYVSPEAEKELRAALELDPANARARYFLGLLALQVGRPDQAFRGWTDILRDESAPDAIRSLILADLAAVAGLAGVDPERIAEFSMLPPAVANLPQPEVQEPTE